MLSDDLNFISASSLPKEGILFGKSEATLDFCKEFLKNAGTSSRIGTTQPANLTSEANEKRQETLSKARNALQITYVLRRVLRKFIKEFTIDHIVQESLRDEIDLFFDRHATVYLDMIHDKISASMNESEKKETSGTMQKNWSYAGSAQDTDWSGKSINASPAEQPFLDSLDKREIKDKKTILTKEFEKFHPAADAIPKISPEEKPEGNFLHNISQVSVFNVMDEIEDLSIIVVDNDGTTQIVNKGTEYIKGYSKNDLIGKNFSILFTEEDRERQLPENLLAVAAKTGKAISEGWYVRKDGSRFWASIIITALHDQHNNIIGYLNITRDNSQRKAAEENIRKYIFKLEDYNEKLELANKELESFNYIVSHDMQVPVRKIRTLCSLILGNGINSLPEKTRERINKIDSTSAFIQDLIINLINYSKATSASSEFQETDLNLLVHEVKSQLTNHDDAQIDISCSRLPVVKVVPFQFNQLFMNLIGNAMKFRKNNVRSYVKISSDFVRGDDFLKLGASPFRNYLRISISDNGIGIDQKEAGKIFDLFYRAVDTSKGSGSGIGLAICKKIVQNHNGIIGVNSLAGEGSEFYILLPEALLVSKKV